jgi:hypothetical protein
MERAGMDDFPSNTIVSANRLRLIVSDLPNLVKKPVTRLQ